MSERDNGQLWFVDMRSKGLTKEGFDRNQEELVPCNELPSALSEAGIGVMDHILLPAYQADDKDGNPIPSGQVRIIRLKAQIGKKAQIETSQSTK